MRELDEVETELEMIVGHEEKTRKDCARKLKQTEYLK